MWIDLRADSRSQGARAAFANREPSRKRGSCVTGESQSPTFVGARQDRLTLLARAGPHLREKERSAEASRSAPNYGAGTACRSAARAAEGVRMTRSPLTTAIHARAMIGEMNRE